MTRNIAEATGKPLHEKLVVNGPGDSHGESFGHDKSAPTGFVCGVAFAATNISKKKCPGEGGISPRESYQEYLRKDQVFH